MSDDLIRDTIIKLAVKDNKPEFCYNGAAAPIIERNEAAALAAIEGPVHRRIVEKVIREHPIGSWEGVGRIVWGCTVCRSHGECRWRMLVLLAPEAGDVFTL